MTLIRKTAAGKKAGSLTYVLSDSTVDRYGDIIEPSGWQLDNFLRNPIALFGHNGSFPIGNWANVRVENAQLLGEFVPAAPGTSQRVDEIVSLIQQDILRATSVGFQAIESVPLDPKNPYNGTRYTQQELLETSIVSVPANPAALQLARSLQISDETMSLAFGGNAARRRDLATTGGLAESKRHSRASPMTTFSISQQIENSQERLNAARDALVELTKDQDHNVEEAEALQGELEQQEQRLASLQRTERALAGRIGQQQLRDTGQGGQQVLPPPRRPLGVPVKEPEPRDLLIRAAAVHLTSYVLRRSVDDVLQQRYPEHEATSVITRAAVTGATTTAPGWAAELVETAQADFLANLDPSALFPRLAPRGTSLTFGPGAGAIKIPSRATTPSIAGSFVAEGQPIPVRRLGLTSITLTPHKIGVISTFSREIAMYSNPAIEGVIREAIRDDTAIMVDGLLIDNVAASVTRPAGLTNGVAAIPGSAVHGYAAILADITALSAPFYAVNAGRALVMMINPLQGLQLSMAPGPDGTFGWTNQFTSRFTVLESTNVPAGSVYMVDAADFVSVSGTPEFDVSEMATLHMEDTAPLHLATGAQGSAVVASPAQSMFQTAQVALRMLANLTWAMRRTGMVQFSTGVNWGPA